MMIKNFTVLILLLGFSSLSFGEEVYYCADSLATGFNPDDDSKGKYNYAKFAPLKFKMKVEGTDITVIFDAEKKQSRYECRQNDRYPQEYICSAKFGYSFNFHKGTGKYVRVQQLGYVFEDTDSVIMAIGSCTKF